MSLKIGPQIKSNQIVTPSPPIQPLRPRDIPGVPTGIFLEGSQPVLSKGGAWGVAEAWP